MSRRPTIDQQPAWRALQRHAEDMRSVHLKELFAAPEPRYRDYCRRAAGLTLDLSKQRWRAETCSSRWT